MLLGVGEGEGVLCLGCITFFYAASRKVLSFVVRGALVETIAKRVAELKRGWVGTFEETRGKD